MYVKYAPKDSPLYTLERDARLGKLGLSEGSPEFRSLFLKTTDSQVYIR